MDVIVIGGGLMGTAAAFFLARRGLSVTLLERGRVGTGATVASFGSEHAFNLGHMHATDQPLLRATAGVHRTRTGVYPRSVSSIPVTAARGDSLP